MIRRPVQHYECRSNNSRNGRERGAAVKHPNEKVRNLFRKPFHHDKGKRYGGGKSRDHIFNKLGQRQEHFIRSDRRAAF